LDDCSIRWNRNFDGADELFFDRFVKDTIKSDA